MKFLDILPSSVRVAAPGYDVDTARMDQLLLSIGFRTGQILGSGLVGTVHTDTNTANPKYSATINYGPFESVPDIMIWSVYDTGYYEICPVYYVQFSILYSPECRANHTLSVNLGNSSGHIVATRPNNDPQKTKPIFFFSYILYRKPLY